MARTRAALLTMTGLSAIGVLAGCASTGTGTADAGTGTAGSAPAGTSTTPAAGSGGTGGAAAGSGAYKDGSYTEQGTYSSPGGQEVISVNLVIASDAVKAVTVKTVKADPTAAQYEAKFIGGIGDVVVGKKIDDLNVTNVAGSSLTSQGFDDALGKIKTDAKA